MTAFDTLLRAVMDATYDTGYYSGKHEDGQPHHREAIAQRCSATQRLQACVKTLVAANRAQAQTLRNLALGFLTGDAREIALNAAAALDTARAPFEEVSDA
ncbi:MAG TPA: hypothetical protein VMY98_03425 [Anaerolineae bacterium]|nr:hypothetical protein [Anaerolineae bacterium]